MSYTSGHPCSGQLTDISDKGAEQVFIYAFHLLLQMYCCIFQATHFRSPLLQQTENQVSSATAHQGQQAVTDVIQQLLELSEPGPVENNQPQQPGQQLNIAVGINRDILQVRAVCEKSFTFQCFLSHCFYFSEICSQYFQ